MDQTLNMVAVVTGLIILGKNMGRYANERKK